jgi:hypothetical protein
MDLLSDYQDEGDTFDPSALVQSDANENDQDEQGMCVLRGIMTFMEMTLVSDSQSSSSTSAIGE